MIDAAHRFAAWLAHNVDVIEKGTAFIKGFLHLFGGK